MASLATKKLTSDELNAVLSDLKTIQAEISHPHQSLNYQQSSRSLLSILSRMLEQGNIIPVGPTCFSGNASEVALYIEQFSIESPLEDGASVQTVLYDLFPLENPDSFAATRTVAQKVSGSLVDEDLSGRKAGSSSFSHRFVLDALTNLTYVAMVIRAVNPNVQSITGFLRSYISFAKRIESYSNEDAEIRQKRETVWNMCLS